MVVLVLVLQGCSLSAAQLNPVEAAALRDLCDRPVADLWANCSDSANACMNSIKWTGVMCDANMTSIVSMYHCLSSTSFPWIPLTFSFILFRSLAFSSLIVTVNCCPSELEAIRPWIRGVEDHFRRRLVILLISSGCAMLFPLPLPLVPPFTILWLLVIYRFFFVICWFLSIFVIIDSDRFLFSFIPSSSVSMSLAGT